MIDMIGDRLKQLRTEAKLTQAAFGAIAKTTKQYVSQIESGKNQVPGPEYLDRWARHFGVTMRWLLSGTGTRSLSESPSTDDAWPPILAYRVAASLGHGGPADEYAETHQLKFRAESLRRKRLKPEKLAVIYGRGDSMHPTIKDGDAILIDTTDTTPRDGKLYVVVDGNDLLAKRLVEIDGQWFAMSDNPAYKPRRLDEANGVRVAGRIRWVAGWVD